MSAAPITLTDAAARRLADLSSVEGRALGGAAWWRSPAAQADIRARVAAGGVGVFPAAWNEPEVFLAQTE